MNTREKELEKELRSIQEMLAYVLDAAGEPVVVKKSRMQEGLDPHLGIMIDDQDDSFVFSLGAPE